MAGGNFLRQNEYLFIGKDELKGFHRIYKALRNKNKYDTIEDSTQSSNQD